MAKRDMDLVRTILLGVEKDGTPALRQMPVVDGVDKSIVAYHIQMMLEAGLVSAIDASSISAKNYLEISLTWEGHEFLENIRDPEVWRKTKAGAAKVGSFSLRLISDIARAAIAAKAQSLGLA